MIINIEEDPRHAGQIKRFHTWPTIQTQTVGCHTWQVMRIMMTIMPNMCTPDVMTYALFHDVGEMAGDLPWPSKRNNPDVKRGMDAAEQQVRVNMRLHWGQPVLPDLSPTEHDFFKMCENLEMWEYGLQERNMGNKYGTVVATRMLLAASDVMSRLPQDIKSSALRYVKLRSEQESELKRDPIDLGDWQHKEENRT